MDSTQFAALLATLRSTDNAARDAAEKNYTEAIRKDPNSVLVALAGCLNPSACDEVLRTQAATLLRRSVVQTGPTETPWSQATANVQAQIRLALFQALESEPSAAVRRILVAGIAAVASHQAQVEAPWVEVVPNALTLAKSANPVHQEAALRLLAELMGTSYAQTIFLQRQEVGALVSAALGTPGLQGAGLSLVAEMVSVLDVGSCQALQPVLPLVEQALKSLAASDASAFEDALQSLVASAAEQAAFFKPRYTEWVDMMLTLAAAKGNIEDKNRSLAFEWISTIAESKSKVLIKAVPDFTHKVLAMAFTFLAEVQEDDDWVGVDEDEEEDDDESLHKAGEAKVDFFVKKIGFGQCGRHMLSLIKQYGTSDRWEGKFAAAMAIRASVEFVDNAAALDEMTSLLVQLTQDQHMRVRYAALHAIGQTCHDTDVEFHNRWHSRLVPRLVQASADPVDRCAAMAAGALEAVIADLDEAILADYAQPILEVFVSKLKSSSHRGVLVAVMEALGALAAGLEGSFDGAAYDHLMAMLLEFVDKPAAEPAAAKLRGKAFECISLLGYAVGKERFAPAAQKTMAAMLATPQVADDMQTDCIRDAMERMCKIMGADFAPFLPLLLPGILASMSLENAVTAAADGVDGDDAEDLVLPTDEGLMKVNTRQSQEILAVVSLLTVFIKETGTSFLEYVKPTAEALNKVLGVTDPVMNCASAVRDSVYPCWAELVQVVSKAVPTKGQEAQALVVELVQRFVDKVAADLVKAEDPDDIAPMAQGVASVVCNAGAGCLEPKQVQAICDLAVSEILKSFQREKALRDCEQGQQLGAPAADDDDDDSVVGDVIGKDEEEEEAECRKGLCAILGASMKANPEVFVSHSWPTLQALMQEWLGPQGALGRLLGLNLSCDLCEHLGERAVAIWPVFMDAVLESVGSDDSDMRGTAAFAVVLAAQVSAFGQQYAPRAYVAVGTAVKSFKPKKNDEQAQRAADNLIAALVQLCLSHPAQCPDLEACWQLIFSKLPLKVDFEEGHKLHRKLFEEVQKPSGGNLGSMARVAHVLGYLCDIYGRSEQCDEDLQKDIARLFAKLPQATLEPLLASFSAKQQKKVERILQDGRH